MSNNTFPEYNRFLINFVIKRTLQFTYTIKIPVKIVVENKKIWTIWLSEVFEEQIFIFYYRHNVNCIDISTWSQTAMIRVSRSHTNYDSQFYFGNSLLYNRDHTQPNNDININVFANKIWEITKRLTCHDIHILEWAKIFINDEK